MSTLGLVLDDFSKEFFVQIVAVNNTFGFVKLDEFLWTNCVNVEHIIGNEEESVVKENNDLDVAPVAVNLGSCG